MDKATYDEFDYNHVPLEVVSTKYVYDYPRPSVTTDIVVFHMDQKNWDAKPYVLLIKRGDKTEACAGMWALPGGYMEIDETLLCAASRELEEETGIKLLPLELNMVGVYDKVDRDTRGRVLTVAYSVVLHDKPKVQPQKGFEHEIQTYGWMTINEITDTMFDMAFDHKQIILDAYHSIEWN